MKKENSFINNDVNKGNEIFAENEQVKTAEQLVQLEKRDISETNEAVKSGKKKSNSLANASILATAAVTTVVLVAGMTAAAPKIDVVDIQSGSNYVIYEMDVENTDDLELNLVVYNDYYSMEIPLNEGNIKGMFKNLAPDTQYTFAVRGSQGIGYKTFLSERFKTKSEGYSEFVEPNVQIQFNRNKNDGEILFRVSMIDPSGYYTNVVAVLTTAKGVKYEYKITDFYKDYAISASELGSGVSVLVVTADTSLPDDVNSGITNKIINKTDIEN